MNNENGPGGQPPVMPTFIEAPTGDDELTVGHEVMHVGTDGIALVENLDGRLETMSVDPEDFIVPKY